MHTKSYFLIKYVLVANFEKVRLKNLHEDHKSILYLLFYYFIIIDQLLLTNQSQS